MWESASIVSAQLTWVGAQLTWVSKFVSKQTELSSNKHVQSLGHKEGLRRKGLASQTKKRPLGTQHVWLLGIAAASWTHISASRLSSGCNTSFDSTYWGKLEASPDFPLHLSKAHKSGQMQTLGFSAWCGLVANIRHQSAHTWRDKLMALTRANFTLLYGRTWPLVVLASAIQRSRISEDLTTKWTFVLKSKGSLLNKRVERDTKKRLYNIFFVLHFVLCMIENLLLQVAKSNFLSCKF